VGLDRAGHPAGWIDCGPVKHPSRRHRKLTAVVIIVNAANVHLATEEEKKIDVGWPAGAGSRSGERKDC